MQKFKNEIIPIIVNHAEKYPEKIAFEFIDAKQSFSISYYELNQKIWQFANYFANKHSKGERVLILLPPGVDYIYSFLGCLAAGLIAVTAYPPSNNHHQKRLEHIIKNAAASSIVSDENYVKYVKGLGPICYDVISIFDEKKSPKVFTRLHEVAFLQYTSGSTGEPKGTMITHENLIAQIKYIKQKISFFEEDRLCSWLPPFHDMGLIGAILYPLYIGMPTILQPPMQFIRNPLGWLKIISKKRATISPAPNFAYELCADIAMPNDVQELDLRSWRLAVNGAEPVRIETLRKFSEKFASGGFSPTAFYPTFGLAEATLMVSSGEINSLPYSMHIIRSAFENSEIIEVPKDNEITSHSIRSIELASVGTIDSPYEYAIVNSKTLEKCVANTIGEIWIKGPSVAIGYWRNEEKSTETFKSYLNNGDGPYMNTGDLGFINLEEKLFVTGRKKDILIYQGKNIYAHDIEFYALNSQSVLFGCASAAFTSSIVDEHHILIIEVKRSENLEVNDIFTKILRALKLELDFIPDQIILTAKGMLPKTSSGKIQRHLARESWEQALIKIIAKWPSSNTNDSEEEKITRIESPHRDKDYYELFINIVKQVTHKFENIEIKDSDAVASLGITSIEVSKILVLYERETNIKINPTLFWEISNFGEFRKKITALASKQ